PTPFFARAFAAPLPLHSFPTRRSSDLAQIKGFTGQGVSLLLQLPEGFSQLSALSRQSGAVQQCTAALHAGQHRHQGNFQRLKQLDRKSTRLNSSHVKISYAVFCLKKKK